ncbi:ABC transporter substrate-binding protein [Kitasatospora sp. NPDC051853]|uniref:ABC transporter substrate-binding protein n=1 Tax=Kitasatospora sp. NPDC051853 TaxID=3364058 RepID=UPI0037991AD3
MTSSPRRRCLGALAALLMAAATASCSSPAADTTATVTFWGWAPGYAEAAAAYTADHPKVRIEFKATDPGSKGGYDAMLQAVADGKGPCLVQVGYESLPAFVAAKAVTPVDTSTARVLYPESAWSQVTVDGDAYGMPVDVGPMALFYRRDVYQRYGMRPQSTWEEFARDADRLHRVAPRTTLTAFTPDDPWWFTALAAQAGAQWFGTQAGKWQVDITGAPTTTMTQYWQGLVDKGLVAVRQGFSPELYKGLGDGTIAAFPAPVWYAALLEQNAPGASGAWAVAPLPGWGKGNDPAVFDGGSATAVARGCPKPEAAAEFAAWLGTDRKALDILVEKAKIYPAAVATDTLPALNAPSPYFGNQVIGDVFRQLGASGSSRWRWGPSMAATSKSLTAELPKALKNRTPMTGALRTVQDATVEAMRGQGVALAGG